MNVIDNIHKHCQARLQHSLQQQYSILGEHSRSTNLLSQEYLDERRAATIVMTIIISRGDQRSILKSSSGIY